MDIEDRASKTKNTNFMYNWWRDKSAYSKKTERLTENKFQTAAVQLSSVPNIN